MRALRPAWHARCLRPAGRGPPARGTGWSCRCPRAPARRRSARWWCPAGRRRGCGWTGRRGSLDHPTSASPPAPPSAPLRWCTGSSGPSELPRLEVRARQDLEKPEEVVPADADQKDDQFDREEVVRAAPLLDVVEHGAQTTAGARDDLHHAEHGPADGVVLAHGLDGLVPGLQDDDLPDDAPLAHPEGSGVLVAFLRDVLDHGLHRRHEERRDAEHQQGHLDRVAGEHLEGEVGEPCDHDEAQFGDEGDNRPQDRDGEQVADREGEDRGDPQRLDVEHETRHQVVVELASAELVSERLKRLDEPRDRRGTPGLPQEGEGDEPEDRQEQEASSGERLVGGDDALERHRDCVHEYLHIQPQRQGDPGA